MEDLCYQPYVTSLSRIPPFPLPSWLPVIFLTCLIVISKLCMPHLLNCRKLLKHVAQLSGEPAKCGERILPILPPCS